MPIEERCNTGTSAIGIQKEIMSKDRLLKLTELAIRTAEQLKVAGLVRNEYCEFGRLMEKVLNLD